MNGYQGYDDFSNSDFSHSNSMIKVKALIDELTRMGLMEGCEDTHTVGDAVDWMIKNRHVIGRKLEGSSISDEALQTYIKLMEAQR